MISPAKIDQAIQKGLDYLAHQQLADGDFESFSSPSDARFTKTYKYRTIFVPALILKALTSVNTPVALNIRNSIADFLLRQKSPRWTFNYWSKMSAEHTGLSYPDDLDDTFCALSALYSHDTGLISGQALAAVVQTLVSVETKPGGPYRTWLNSPSDDPAWQNIDLVVNSNVAHFLGMVSKPLPSLDNFLEEHIITDDFKSDYYPSLEPILYFLSRAYRAGSVDIIIQKVLAALNRYPGPMSTALLLTALRKCEHPPDRLVQTKVKRLLEAQQPDGSWPAAAFCRDPTRNGRQHYHGAEVLSTALAIEALAGWKPRPKKLSNKPNKGPIYRTRRLLTDAPVQLRLPALDLLKTTVARDANHEITSLAYFTNVGFHRPSQNLAPLEKLGSANMLGWMAYTIFDDVLDSEPGAVKLLPLGIYLARASKDSFTNIFPEQTGFNKFVDRTFTRIDNANAWELNNCRTIDELPNYKNLQYLADRSLGHSLPALGSVIAGGFNCGSREFRCVQQAFSHYLIARQLSDDLHDWQTDLQNGHISYVVSELLRAKPSNRRKHFWNVTFGEVSHTALHHIELGQKLIQSSQLFTANNYLSKRLSALETTFTDGLDQQRQSLDFLHHYKS